MPKEFINPNLHVILIHYPLALLGLGTLIELFAFLWRRSAVRIAGRWMILLGAIALVPAATAGLYAMAQVNRTADTTFDATWAEVRQASPVQGPAWEMMTNHAWLNAAGAAVILLVVVLWLGGSDVWRSRLHFVYLLALLGGYGLIVAGAWHGGELVYSFGVGVKSAQASEAGGADHTASHAPEPAEAEAAVKHDINYYAPPMEVHVILAGLAVAIGLVAIGASLRAGAQVNVTVEPTPELADIGAALNPNIRSIAAGGTLRSYDDVALRAKVRRPPVARFWLVAALLAIATGLTGWWTLASRADIWTIDGLWKQIVDHNQNGDSYRRLAHGIMTGAIVGLMLLLTLVSRWVVGRRFVLGLLSMLLLLAVASQIWFGSLLMFDTNQGRIDRFNGTELPAAATSASPAKVTPKTPDVMKPTAPTTSDVTKLPTTTTKPATTSAATEPAT